MTAEPPKNQNPNNAQTKSHQTEHVSIFTQDPGIPKRKFLGLEPKLVSRILKLGWPVIVGMLTQTAINTIDLLMVGRLPDEIAVPGAAAILSSIVLLWAFGGFLASISVGTQAISARRFSEGHLKKTGQVLTNSIAVAVVASLLLTVVAEYLAEPLIKLMTPSEAVQQIGISYSKIRFIGLFSMATMASYKSFYDGIGRVRVHMTIAIIMNIINVIFDYLLIFGFSIGTFEVAPMHVDGAALGSVISSYAGLFIMVAWTLRKRDRKTFGIYQLRNFSPKIAWSVAKLSFWSGMATVVLMAGVGMFNYIVNMIDQVQGVQDINSSAASIIIHVMMLVFMSALAFGTSTATLVSQSIGANNPDLAERYGWQSVRLAVYAMAVFGIITVCFPEPVLRIFMPSDLDLNSLKDAVVQTAIPSMQLAAGALSPLAAAGLVLTQALYGAGKTRYVMIVEFLLHFGLLVPLTWVLAIEMDMGLLGCWTAAVAYAFALLVATGYKFYKGDWKHTVL